MARAPSNDKQKFLIDARPLQGADSERGIGTYVRGLLAGLVESGLGQSLGLLVDLGLPVPEMPDAGLVAYGVRRRYPGRLAAYEDAFALPRDLARIRPRLFHATSLRLPRTSPCPLVATLHDLIPWALGGAELRGERIRHLPGRRLLRAADRVIAVSRSAATDAVELARVREERIRVVGEGVRRIFTPRPGAAERVGARWGLEGRYLLHVGALDARKDPGSLLRAWRLAREAGAECSLVLAGNLGRQAPTRLGDAVRVGHVTDPELVDLYSAAACFVFPSRYEGFGLPVLEALACGCPVVTYDNSSLPEVGGAAATRVRDGDANALGAAVARLLLDPRAAARARRAGPAHARRHTWLAAARATARIYREVLR